MKSKSKALVEKRLVIREMTRSQIETYGMMEHAKKSAKIYLALLVGAIVAAYMLHASILLVGALVLIVCGALSFRAGKKLWVDIKDKKQPIHLSKITKEAVDDEDDDEETYQPRYHVRRDREAPYNPKVIIIK